jgi:hypothetical protein
MPMATSMAVKEHGEPFNALFTWKCHAKRISNALEAPRGTLFFGQPAKFCVLFSHGTTRLKTKILLIKQGSEVPNLQSQVETIKTAACHEVLSATIRPKVHYFSNFHSPR